MHPLMDKTYTWQKNGGILRLRSTSAQDSPLFQQVAACVKKHLPGRVRPTRQMFYSMYVHPQASLLHQRSGHYKTALLGCIAGKTTGCGASPAHQLGAV
jgi:hypothetical protein